MTMLAPGAVASTPSAATAVGAARTAASGTAASAAASGAAVSAASVVSARNAVSAADAVSAAAPATAVATPTEAPAYGYAADKQALIKRLHRISGQVRGIENMVSGDRYCIDIITQISAVTTALDALAFKILDEHVQHCVAGALAAGEPEVAAAKSRELLDAVHRFARAR